VTDTQGNVYATNSAGQVTINGKVDTTTAAVESLGFYNGIVWQKNTQNCGMARPRLPQPGSTSHFRRCPHAGADRVTQQHVGLAW